MNKPGSKYILILVFIIFGIVIAVQFKSTLYSKRITASNRFSVDTLKEQLTKEKAEVSELKVAIDENLAMRNELIREYLDQQNDDLAKSEWEMIKLNTGLVGVKGPGITIRLDDAPARQPETPLSWLIIHDMDIKVILNELKIAGAQAIAINGERVVPMSEQVCAGPTILINGNRHPVPYLIEVIGDPDILYESITTSSRIAEMTEFKIRVDVKKMKEIKLPKFSGADRLSRYLSGLEVVTK